MTRIYYVKTERWNDGQYQQQLAEIFHGEQAQFVEIDGDLTCYSLETEPQTFDQQWIVGSTRESVLAARSARATFEDILTGHNKPKQEVVEQKPVTEEATPTLVALLPFGKQVEVKLLLPNSDELQYAPMFVSEQEAMAWITQKYPHHQVVDSTEFIIEYHTRVEKSGSSFAERSWMMR